MPTSKIKTRYLTIVLIGTLSSSFVYAQELPFRTEKLKITSKIAKDSAPSETAQAMVRAGIDLPALLQQAMNGSEPAVKLLFWCSANIGLDGAAADGFGNYLLEVGKEIGDIRLSKILTTIKDPNTLEMIRFYLLDESGFNLSKKESEKKAMIALQALLPKTLKYLNSVGEQNITP